MQPFVIVAIICMAILGVFLFIIVNAYVKLCTRYDHLENRYHYQLAHQRSVEFLEKTIMDLRKSYVSKVDECLLQKQELQEREDGLMTALAHIGYLQSTITELSSIPNTSK